MFNWYFLDGINDGFLTPYKLKEIATTYDTYQYTSDDTVIEGEIEEGRTFTQEEQNRVIELMDVERYRVKLFMDLINQKHKTLKDPQLENLFLSLVNTPQIEINDLCKSLQLDVDTILSMISTLNSMGLAIQTASNLPFLLLSL